MEVPRVRTDTGPGLAACIGWAAEKGAEFAAGRGRVRKSTLEAIGRIRLQVRALGGDEVELGGAGGG